MDRRPAVVESDAVDFEPMDSAMRVPEGDPFHALDRRSRLLVHPPQQSPTGLLLAMGRAGDRQMDPGRDRDLVRLVTQRTGRRFVSPTLAVGQEAVMASATFDHIAMDQQHIFDPQGIEPALKPWLLSRPITQTPRERFVRVVIPIEIDKGLVRKTILPTGEPSDRPIDGRRFILQTAPAEIEHVAPPDTEVTPLDGMLDLFLMPPRITA